MSRKWEGDWMERERIEENGRGWSCGGGEWEGEELGLGWGMMGDGREKSGGRGGGGYGRVGNDEEEKRGAGGEIDKGPEVVEW